MKLTKARMCWMIAYRARKRREKQYEEKCRDEYQEIYDSIVNCLFVTARNGGSGYPLILEKDIPKIFWLENKLREDGFRIVSKTEFSDCFLSVVIFD
jgi:hypothetical protein